MRGRLSLAAVFTAGVVFAVGLGVSGMTDPGKVIGFLNLAGEWDPSLALVLGAAIGVHAVAYRWIVRQPSPVFATRFQIPTRRDLTPRLVVGATLFGFGWALAGYCPGPGIVSLAGRGPSAVVFVAAMLLGMGAYRVVDGQLARAVARRSVTARSRTP